MLVSVGVVVAMSTLSTDPSVVSARSNWYFWRMFRYLWCSVTLMYVSFFGLWML